MSDVTLHLGDCLDVMRSMPDGCVDAVVCDPPYFLGFMNKGWDAARGRDTRALDCDGIAGSRGHGRKPGESGDIARQNCIASYAVHLEWATEALRVAKPGAHLLAFGGTRTFHRLACAIEDAGWQIRDSLIYLHGQGFPKGINVNRDPRFCSCSAALYSHEANGEVRGVREIVSGVPANDSQGEGADVLSPVQRDVARSGVGEACPQGSRGLDGCESRKRSGEDVRASEPGMEGRGDVLPDARCVCGSSVRPSTGVGACDGTCGRLRDGASVGDGEVDRATAEPGRGGPPSKPQARRQSKAKPRIVAEQRHAQDGGAWSTCDRCRKPMVPAGLNTALKPAHEPIVMARKPLAGTVAANVERFGTGALNVDACRLSADGNITFASRFAGDRPRDQYRTGTASGQIPANLGRWPANVMLDEVAAEMLDRQSGERKSPPCVTSGFRRGGGDGPSVGLAGRKSAPDGYGDSGGASRFFYCAKASRSEREAGLDGFEVRPGTIGQKRCALCGRQAINMSGTCECPDPQWVMGADVLKARNHHPTVKPVALMRWLVRLVTPPGGLVLDPFTGSGTTALACIAEGRAFVGAEREPEYHAIAEARIAHARGETLPSDEQRGLDFGGAA